MRNTVEEIGRAIERIDDPTRLGRIAGDLPSLLHQETPIGPGLAKLFIKCLLSTLVGHRDEISRPLAAHLELLDLVEIAPEPRRRLARGTLHHRDEPGMRDHRSAAAAR